VLLTRFYVYQKALTMNRMKQVIKAWEADSSARPMVKTVSVQLTAKDYARLQALEELFPVRSKEQMLSELVATALDEIEEAFPYVQGEQVIAEDEFGDPIYADVGLTPRFEELTKKYLAGVK
jgi:hypothetical protein